MSHLPEPVAAKLLEYLEDLTPQQERDLAGARDRLAIIAESDAGRWLDPQTPGERIDLRTALEQGDVVLFRLDADRLSLAAPMVAGAIMQNLAAICAAPRARAGGTVPFTDLRRDLHDRGRSPGRGGAL